jgi:hypothetical protein
MVEICLWKRAKQNIDDAREKAAAPIKHKVR